MEMKNNNWVPWLIGIGSVIFMTIVLWQNYVYASKLGKDYQGIFGDMFGASNAIFTGLSFTGLIITILLQRKDIKETQEEVKRQSADLHLQRFENTFFSLVNCHHQIINDLKTNSYVLKSGVREYTYYEGREVFSHLAQSIFNNIQNDINTFNLKFSKIYDGFGDKYLHYIRSLFRLIKFVDDHTFNEDNIINKKKKEKYIAIIWDQLADHEVTLIFYNCIYKDENPEYKQIIEKYALMKNVKDIFVHDELKKLYSPNAFNKTNH